MFVRKSTHLAALAGLQAANRLLIAERDGLQRRIRGLRQELATTYVRDSKGRIARHPGAAK